MYPPKMPPAVSRPFYRSWAETQAEVYKTAEEMGLSLSEAFRFVRQLDRLERV